jgi:CRP/FNR family cyclic AMP-dependent transcriptional regulator
MPGTVTADWNTYQFGGRLLLRGMKTHDSVAAALSGTARYGNCGRRELQDISRTCTRVTVPAGTVLATEGERRLDFGIVVEGTATVRSGTHDLVALQPGDHFGEVALLDDGPSLVTVIAATPMTLAVVGPAEFGSLLERSPAVARAVLSGLARRVRNGVAA